jgi:hypothetical protein
MDLKATIYGTRCGFIRSTERVREACRKMTNIAFLLDFSETFPADVGRVGNDVLVVG